jgi:hypothetical protein
MTTPAKRLASKAHKPYKSPLHQIGEQVVEGTRFLLASIVLVYVVVLVSPQDVMSVSESWINTLETTELTDSLVLELRPVLEENDSIQKVKTEASSSYLITFSPDSSELA